MSAVLSLIRPELLTLRPYVSAKMLAGGVAAPIALDANESPWPPFGPMADLCEVHHYNDSRPLELYRRVAEINGVSDAQLIMTRGSSEAIDLLIRLFCRAEVDEILICPPTFSMYQVYACIQGAKVLSVPLREDGQLDLPAIQAACTPNTKLIFIPTPNAPLGHAMNADDLLALCHWRAGQSVIVADEAYIEFTETPRGMLPVLAEHQNLVVLRTLSKAYALAGERLGLALADETVIDMLMRIQSPFSLPQSSMRAAMDALSPEGLALALERHALLNRERDRLLALLPASPLLTRVFPSVANFMLLQAKDLEALTEALARFGIRGRANVCTIARTLRLSLGTPEQNDLILRALGVQIPEPDRAARAMG